MWCTHKGVEYQIQSNKDCDNISCLFRRNCMWYASENEPETYSDNQTKSIKERYTKIAKTKKFKSVYNNSSVGDLMEIINGFNKTKEEKGNE